MQWVRHRLHPLEHKIRQAFQQRRKRVALQLTIGEVLDLVPVVKQSLVKNGLMDSSGNLVKHPVLVEAEDIALVVVDVEAALKNDGLVVPANLDKYVKVILALFPTVVTLVGS